MAHNTSAVPEAAELTLDPASTALLILHYQNDVVHPKGVLGALYADRVKAAHNIEHSLAAIKASRDAGIRVIYVKASMSPGAPEISDNPSPIAAGFKLSGGLMDGTWGSEIVDELKPEEDEGNVVMRNYSTNAFLNTPLDQVLRGHGITHVVIAGIATAHFVVLSTTLAASDRGYFSIVLKDCCNDATDEMHNWILNHVLNDCSVISDSESYIRAIKG